MPRCPIHIIIRTQTFSVSELLSLIDLAIQLEICDSCIWTMRKKVQQAIGEQKANKKRGKNKA